jgi:hypothetical protein
MLHYLFDLFLTGQQIIHREGFNLLGYNVAWSVESQQTFRSSVYYLLQAGLLLGLFFDYEDGGHMFI